MRRIRLEGTVEELLPATPEAIWSVLTDPTRIGEWSNECRCGSWLNGATEPTVDARFIGRSRVRWVRWSRPCRVLEVDAPHRYRYETISPADCTNHHRPESWSMNGAGPPDQLKHPRSASVRGGRVRSFVSAGRRSVGRGPA